MVDRYRPTDWKNPYIECNENCKKAYSGKPFNAVEIAAYEVGADAMLDALWKLAEESPTRTFTLDANLRTAYARIFDIKEEK